MKEGCHRTTGKQGVDTWENGTAGPQKGQRNGQEKSLFGSSGPLHAVVQQRGNRKADGWGTERLPTILRAQLGSHVPLYPPLGRTKGICLDLEYKPRLESRNAPEGTSKNV